MYNNRLNTIKANDLMQIVVNQYTNILLDVGIANNVIVKFTDTTKFSINCNDDVIKMYSTKSSNSPACANAIFNMSNKADTVCGICYKYAEEDNPVYGFIKINTYGDLIKQVNEKFRIAFIEYLQADTEMQKQIEMLIGILNSAFVPIFIQMIYNNNIYSALLFGVNSEEYESIKIILYYNQIYDVVAETMWNIQSFVLRMKEIYILYNTYYLQNNIDNFIGNSAILSQTENIVAKSDEVNNDGIQLNEVLMYGKYLKLAIDDAREQIDRDKLIKDIELKAKEEKEKKEKAEMERKRQNRRLRIIYVFIFFIICVIIYYKFKGDIGNMNASYELHRQS